MTKSDFHASELSTRGSSESDTLSTPHNLIETVEQVETELVQNLHGVRRASRTRKIR
jgi:hypothetical protein